MRYRLRTLLILLAVMPPLLWGVFSQWQRFEVWLESRRGRSPPAAVINVPALGPAPLAFDFAFPVASQDSPETEAIKP